VRYNATATAVPAMGSSTPGLPEVPPPEEQGHEWVASTDSGGGDHPAGPMVDWIREALPRRRAGRVGRCGVGDLRRDNPYVRWLSRGNCNEALAAWECKVLLLCQLS
jgi:hypothetical protein